MDLGSIYVGAPLIRAIHNSVRHHEFAADRPLFAFAVDKSRGLSACWYRTWGVSIDETLPAPYEHVLFIT